MQGCAMVRGKMSLDLRKAALARARPRGILRDAKKDRLVAIVPELDVSAIWEMVQSWSRSES